MTDTSGAQAPFGDESAALPAPGAAGRAVSPLDYAAIAAVAAAALLLLAGIVYAFAVADARNVDGAERFRLLAQASSPFVATLALAGIAIVVHERRRDDRRQVAAGAAVAAGAVVALLASLLALNGMIVDLTSAVGPMFKLSNVLGRLATVGLAGYALWLAAATPVNEPLGPPRLR